jgi:hypothetical protein
MAIEEALGSIDLLSRMLSEAAVLHTAVLDNAEHTSRAWRVAVPGAAVLVLAHCMMIPEGSARRMIKDFGHARRALAFALRLRVALDGAGAVVAGSAALYVERLRAGVPTRFVPGDIDVWADSPQAADQAFDNLKRLGLSSGRVTLRRLNFEDYIDIQQKMFEDPKWLENDAAPVDGFVAHRPTIQIASLKSAPGITVQVIACTHATQPMLCDCDPAYQGCSCCLTGKTEARYSVPPWPKRRPDRRFDLDAVSCVMPSVDVVQRTSGSTTGPGMRLLASAVWYADGVSVPVGVLGARLQKYVDRGYTEPVVAESMTIGGALRPTPQAVLDMVRERREKVY